MSSSNDPLAPVERLLDECVSQATCGMGEDDAYTQAAREAVRLLLDVAREAIRWCVEAGAEESDPISLYDTERALLAFAQGLEER